MDLSKAFDTVNHEIWIAKLHCFNNKVLYSYLNNTRQRTKVNESFSTWAEPI